MTSCYHRARCLMVLVSPLMTAGAALAQPCTPHWLSDPMGVGGPVFALTTWDPDGSGPQSAVLVVGGRFVTVGGVTTNNIATWDGVTWRALGGGMTVGQLDGPAVFALTTWDPDGAGPLLPQLIAGGRFVRASGITVNNIARWDGAGWQPLGTGTDDGSIADVRSLAVLSNGDLIAGGDFDRAGGITVNSIARWNGVAWSALGSGVDGVNQTVNAMAVTPIGDLFAGGDFSAVVGAPGAAYLARWSNSAWSAVGGGVNWWVSGLTAAPDGSVFAGGRFSVAGGAAVNKAARWSGTGWSALGTGFSGEIRNFSGGDVLVMHRRPSGDIIAGGFFAAADGAPAKGIAKWNGSAWSPLGTGMNEVVWALASLPGGELVVGGEFTSAGGLATPYLARWTETGIPWVALQPLPQSATVGSAATLSATPATGYSGITAEWRLETAPGSGVYAALSAGPIPGSMASAAITQPNPSSMPGPTTLHLTSLDAPLNGRRVQAMLSNACGSAASSPALLTVTGGTCPANCDASTAPPVLNVADFVCFLNKFAAGDADANCDGSTAPPTLNVADFICFVNAFAAGCP